MISTDEIVEKARALPPSERVSVVHSLLRSLHPPEPAEAMMLQVTKRSSAIGVPRAA